MMEERKKAHTTSKGDWNRSVEMQGGRGAGLRNGDPARFLDVDVPAFAETIDLLGGES